MESNRLKILDNDIAIFCLRKSVYKKILNNTRQRFSINIRNKRKLVNKGDFRSFNYVVIYMNHYSNRHIGVEKEYAVCRMLYGGTTLYENYEGTSMCLFIQLHKILHTGKFDSCRGFVAMIENQEFAEKIWQGENVAIPL